MIPPRFLPVLSILTLGTACAEVDDSITDPFYGRGYHAEIENSDLALGVSEVEPSEIAIDFVPCDGDEVCASFWFDGTIGLNLVFVSHELDGPYSLDVVVDEINEKTVDFEMQIPPQELISSLQDTEIWIIAHGRFHEDGLELDAKVRYGDVPFKIGKIDLDLVWDAERMEIVE